MSPQKEEIMGFDYCGEYLRSKSNKILLWQCYEKQILVQLSFADWWKNWWKNQCKKKLEKTGALIFPKLLNAYKVLIKRNIM